MGQIGARLSYFGPLAFVFQNDQWRFGMSQNVLDFRRAVGCINARSHSAGHHGRQLADDPFRPIDPQHADDVPRFDPDRYHGLGRRFDLSGEFLPVCRYPGAADFFEIGGCAWPNFLMLEKSIDDTVAIVCHVNFSLIRLPNSVAGSTPAAGRLLCREASLPH